MSEGMLSVRTADLRGDLLSGASEAFPAGELEKKLGLERPLRVKLGFDPTRPDLHLGHAVVLNGLRRFQQAGHEVVVIIGDFTACIGDPTGKESARPPLSREEVEANSATYLEQLGILIDLERAEIRRNSEWLNPLTLAETLRLLGQATVAQMLQRESFSKRYEQGNAIGLHELLYPLLQGYDSVAVGADVELGGVDQRFNLLVGRDLQCGAGQSPQVCVTYPILEGTDGVLKMSKSLDNYVGLTMAADEMYGRVMSIPDHLLPSWFRLASGKSTQEVERLLADLSTDRLHPRDAKMALARSIAGVFHGSESAQAAEQAFVRQFQHRELPLEIPQKEMASGSYPVVPLLVELGLMESTSAARRLIEQKGVKLHSPQCPPTVLVDPKAEVTVSKDSVVLQAGKRRFLRLVGI